MTLVHSAQEGCVPSAQGLRPASRLLAIAAIGLGLASCVPADDANSTGVRANNEEGEDAYTRIWTDPDTGCDYLYRWGYPEAKMPRISSDGFHVYCADQKAGRVTVAPEAA